MQHESAGRKPICLNDSGVFLDRGLSRLTESHILWIHLWIAGEHGGEGGIAMLTIERPTSVAPVTEDVGRQIRTRRTRLGMPVKALAERAGVDRGRLAAIEGGRAHNVRATTIGAIERALDDLEQEMGVDAETPAPRTLDPEGEFVEFVVEGNLGVRVVVKGPVKNMAELQAAAERLVAGMQRDESARRSQP